MLGILCGLESEASIARNILDSHIACSGARPLQARALARGLIHNGAKRLISFGVAGGLDSTLPLGSLIIGTHVASAGGTWPCIEQWVHKLSSKLPQAQCGGVWGSEILIPTAIDKRALYEKSRCLIVDMESQCSAQIAAEANIPHIVVRAVCDSATMDVPPVLMASIAENGSIDYVRAALHVLRYPKEIPDLFRVTRGLNSALEALNKTIDPIGY